MLSLRKSITFEVIFLVLCKNKRKWISICFLLLLLLLVQFFWGYIFIVLVEFHWENYQKYLVSDKISLQFEYFRECKLSVSQLPSLFLFYPPQKFSWTIQVFIFNILSFFTIVSSTNRVRILPLIRANSPSFSITPYISLTGNGQPHS